MFCLEAGSPRAVLLGAPVALVVVVNRAAVVARSVVTVVVALVVRLLLVVGLLLLVVVVLVGEVGPGGEPSEPSGDLAEAESLLEVAGEVGGQGLPHRPDHPPRAGRQAEGHHLGRQVDRVD